MSHTFSAKNVVVAYRGGARALRQFDLDFSGKCLAVVGGEKDGKTTLVNAVSGLVNYDGEFILVGQQRAGDSGRLLPVETQNRA